MSREEGESPSRPQELQAEAEHARQDLADTVAELHGKMDAKTAARHPKQQARARRAQRTAGQAREDSTAQPKTAQVIRWSRENPKPLSAAAAGVGGAAAAAIVLRRHHAPVNRALRRAVTVAGKQAAGSAAVRKAAQKTALKAAQHKAAKKTHTSGKREGAGTMGAKLYKVFSIVVTLASSKVASALVTKAWTKTRHQDTAPAPTDESQRMREILAAAVAQAVVTAVIKASMNRGGAVGMRRMTGNWPA